LRELFDTDKSLLCISIFYLKKEIGKAAAQISMTIQPGVAKWLRHRATSRTVLGSIPGGVTGDFFRGFPNGTTCPEVDSASESEYQGFLLG
jgi:hypothetical protein